jgi:hypothetical protein
MAYLFEGLKAGDLDDLVLPTISIDEYESKLDDDSIVVAFYVSDKDPANDLNRFIQKGSTAILDTDVSPAPNEDGYYVVFVELLRDKDFPKKLTDILATLEGLTSIKVWQAEIHDVESLQVVDAEMLVRDVRLYSVEEPTVDDEEVMEFFKPSNLDNLIFEGNTLTFERLGNSYSYELVDLGEMEAVAEDNAILTGASRVDESALANTRGLERALGHGWVVDQRGDNFLMVGRLQESKIALLKF